MKTYQHNKKNHHTSSNSRTATKYCRVPSGFRAIDPKFRMDILWSSIIKTIRSARNDYHTN